MLLSNLTSCPYPVDGEHAHIWVLCYNVNKRAKIEGAFSFFRLDILSITRYLKHLHNFKSGTMAIVVSHILINYTIIYNTI